MNRGILFEFVGGEGRGCALIYKVLPPSSRAQAHGHSLSRPAYKSAALYDLPILNAGNAGFLLAYFSRTRWSSDSGGTPHGLHT